MDKKKKISIFNFLESIGCMWGKYDENENKIKNSPKIYLKSYFILLMTSIYPLKLNYCLTLDPNDKNSLLIYGDLHYYYSKDVKKFIALLGK